VLAVGAGLSEAQACAMSVLVFTGGSQFAAISVIGAGGAAATGAGQRAAAGRAQLRLRAVAGLAVAGHAPKRAASAQLVIDETTARARAQDSEPDARGAFYLTGLAVFVCWNGGTLAGALAGSGLGDPAAYGLDAMFPAAFLALLAPQLKQDGAVAAALAGALIAVVLLPIAPTGVPVIAAGLGVFAGLRRRA
jgi:predicted branched-subunit amino acid permease